MLRCQWIQISGCQGTRVLGRCGARVPGCWGVGVPRYQGAGTLGCGDAKVPGYQGTGVSHPPQPLLSSRPYRTTAEMGSGDLPASQRANKPAELTPCVSRVLGESGCAHACVQPGACGAWHKRPPLPADGTGRADAGSAAAPVAVPRCHGDVRPETPWCRGDEHPETPKHRGDGPRGSPGIPRHYGDKHPGVPRSYADGSLEMQ